MKKTKQKKKKLYSFADNASCNFIFYIKNIKIVIDINKCDISCLV